MCAVRDVQPCTEDMKILFDGIPLDKMSVSMTMNGAVLPVLAGYIVAAEEQGAAAGQALRHHPERHPQGVHGPQHLYLPAGASMRIVADIIAYTAENMPKFNSISISGYHMQEAGATAGAGARPSPGRRVEYVRAAMAAGLDVDAFAPRLSFFFAIGMNFFMEVAKLRAARLLWAGDDGASSIPKNPRSPDAAHPLPDLGRVAHRAGPLQQRRPHHDRGDGRGAGRHPVAAHQRLRRGDRPADPFSARIARNTQLILQERDRHHQGRRSAGRQLLRGEADRHLAAEARKLIDEVEEMGGMTKAVESGMPKLRIEEAAARARRASTAARKSSSASTSSSRGRSRDRHPGHRQHQGARGADRPPREDPRKTPRRSRLRRAALEA